MDTMQDMTFPFILSTVEHPVPAVARREVFVLKLAASPSGFWPAMLQDFKTWHVANVAVRQRKSDGVTHDAVMWILVLGWDHVQFACSNERSLVPRHIGDEIG